MKKAPIYKLLLFTLLCLCAVTRSSAQSGMTFAEFAKKLDPYFEKELVADLSEQLPQGAQYRIWGWDVGDYTGDGYNDVAFSIRLLNDKTRNVQVYLFADIDGFLTKLAQFPYTFVEIPLEVGVNIRNGICYVMKKREQYNWSIRGYKYDAGSVMLVDEFNTSRLEQFTKETYRNYQDLRSTERYLKGDDPAFYTQGLIIPSYPRGQYVYRGYSAEAKSGSIDFVTKGAYYWNGENDASCSVRSAYDENYLYLTIRVNDDVLVPEQCDSCPSDYLRIWFDTTPLAKGETRTTTVKKKKFAFRTSTDSGIYSFTLRPGNFLDRRPAVRVSSLDNLDLDQTGAVSEVKVSAALRPHGYLAKIRIPFSILGYGSMQLKPDERFEIGTTVVVHDIDNEFRPGEESWVASSAFSPMDPSSYGSILLMPQGQWYGESVNTYVEPLIKSLEELGF